RSAGPGGRVRRPCRRTPLSPLSDELLRRGGHDALCPFPARVRGDRLRSRVAAAAFWRWIRAGRAPTDHVTTRGRTRAPILHGSRRSRRRAAPCWSTSASAESARSPSAATDDLD